MGQETLAMEMLKELKKSGQRKFIIIIILIIALIGSNIAWLIHDSQFETIDQDEQYIEGIENSENSSYTQTMN